MNNWTFLPNNKDFYEVKHLHEVAYTASCSIFFRNLFRICQGLGLVVQGGIVEGKMFRVKNPGGNCPRGSFIRVNSSGGNCPGGKLFRSNYPEGKSLEGNFLGENFIGGSCPGGNIQGK